MFLVYGINVHKTQLCILEEMDKCRSQCQQGCQNIDFLSPLTTRELPLSLLPLPRLLPFSGREK